MSFVELIEGQSLQGDPDRLDVAAATRLGRAFGTALRRRTGGGPRVVVVARAGDGDELALRDGVVRGLLLAGHQVKDVGVLRQEQLAFAFTHVGAAGGVLASCTETGRCSLAFSLGLSPGSRAMTGDALLELATLADGDDHAAGVGSLAFVDVQGALRAAARDGSVL